MGHYSSILSKGQIWKQLIVLSFLLISCTKDNLQKEKIQICESRGVITGPDMRMCPSPCCGGWDITINDKNYTFSQLPDGSGINLEKVKFPLKVRLDWKLDSLGCNHIIITRIAFAEFKSEGTIIGYDPRECLCCGGLKIIISDATYLISEWPTNSCLDLSKEKLPVKVQLDWAKDSTSVCGNIIVTSVAKVE